MELTVQIEFPQLVEAILKLPPEQRKSIQLVLENEPIPQRHKERLFAGERIFGTLKGLVTYMADDFDAPLDDLREYM